MTSTQSSHWPIGWYNLSSWYDPHRIVTDVTCNSDSNFKERIIFWGTPRAQYRISPNGGRSNCLEVKYFFLALMCGKWSEKRVGTHFGAYYWVPRSLERVSFSALASAGERGNGIADSYESSTLLWYFFWAKFILGDENTIVKRHKYDKKNKIY